MLMQLNSLYEVTGENQLDINAIIRKYNCFIDSCYVENEGYKLCPNSEVTPYALCFAIFGKHLIGENEELEGNKKHFDSLLRNNLALFKNKLQKQNIPLQKNKAYLQLLCFTLSALSILNTLKDDPLSEHINELLSVDIKKILTSSGVFMGKAGTGNLAMFYAIFILHSEEYLNEQHSELLQWWVSEHLQHMNKHGFWGDASNISYLQFQNGYHQYEIFEYLDVKVPGLDNTISSVSKLVDVHGHFAPYPGGGGCYDYDAIFMLTSLCGTIDADIKKILLKTLQTIMLEQNSDGGFCESKYIRPLTPSNLVKITSHATRMSGAGMSERIKYCLTLLRAKHNRVKTHWSVYSRGWDESDLWDSWFRMLAIARIQNYLKYDESNKWNFINYPGIGFHHSLIK